MEPAKQPLYKRLFTLTWEGAYQWLVVLALGLIVAWLSQRKMPSAIAHPAEYWLFTGSVLFGSIACFLSFAKLTGWGTGEIRRWCHPHSLRLIACGGQTAAVEVEHSGSPATWEARLRILRIADNHTNPDPILRQCFLRKDGNGYRSLLLKDGESASIILAHIRWSHPLSSGRSTWVEIQNAENDGVSVDADVVVEVNVTAKPPMGKAIKRCFQIARAGTNIMQCSDAPCS